MFPQMLQELSLSIHAYCNAWMHFPVLHQMQSEIQTFVIGDEGIKCTLKRCWEENKYLLCPHTAVAAAYHYSALDAGSVGYIAMGVRC